MFKASFFDRPDRQARLDIASQVIELAHQSGGRFLKRSDVPSAKWWEIASREDVVKKVHYTMRSRKDAPNVPVPQDMQSLVTVLDGIMLQTNDGNPNVDIGAANEAILETGEPNSVNEARVPGTMNGRNIQDDRNNPNNQRSGIEQSVETPFNSFVNGSVVGDPNLPSFVHGMAPAQSGVADLSDLLAENS